MNLESEDSRDNTESTAKQDTSKPKDEVTLEPVTTEPSSPWVPKCHKTTCYCEKKRDWLDYITMVLQGLGLLFLVAYTVFTIKIWRASKQSADAATVAAIATKKSVDLQIKIAEGSQAAWLMPSSQDLYRNFLSFGVQNMGSINAENVAVTVEMKLIKLSDSRTVWIETFAFDTVKYLAPKQNTNGQWVRTISKYTRQDFERITREKETLILNWTATYNNGFKRDVQQSGCAQYLALFKAPEGRAMPQWVGCDASRQLLRQLQPPSEQWSLQ